MISFFPRFRCKDRETGEYVKWGGYDDNKNYRIIKDGNVVTLTKEEFDEKYTDFEEYRLPGCAP